MTNTILNLSSLCTHLQGQFLLPCEYARRVGHLCPEMHLTLILGTLYKTESFLSFSYDFMFDRIICVLVRI